MADPTFTSIQPMKTINAIKYMFSGIGVTLLIVALLLFWHTRTFIDQAATAPGTVIDLVESRSDKSTTYRPVVRFVAESGQQIEFTSSSSTNPPSYSVGEDVTVLYLPAEPQNASLTGFFDLWGGAMIVGGLGCVFSLIGAGFVVFDLLRRRKEEFLKQHGIPIDTEFQGVELNKSIRVGGRHPFRVVTQWLNPMTSELHVFTSNNLWFDPTSFIQNRRVTVFIERDNPRRYYVDLSFLPKLAA